MLRREAPELHQSERRVEDELEWQHPVELDHLVVELSCWDRTRSVDRRTWHWEQSDWRQDDTPLFCRHHITSHFTAS